MIALLVTLIAATELQSTAGYTGRWSYQNLETSATLELNQNAKTDRVTGVLTLDDDTAPIEGRVRNEELVMEKLGGLPISLVGLSMVARLDGSNLVMTTSSPGEASQTVTMTPTTVNIGVASGLDAVPSISNSLKTNRTSRADDFVGHWEVTSDDETSTESLEISISGNSVNGTLIEVDRGYFSSRESIKAQYVVRGSLQDRTLRVSINEAKARGKAVEATIFRRGKFLVIRNGEFERGYARPGQDVVESADGSAEAAALESAIAGRVYSVSSQAYSAGTFGGKRMRLALCADRSIAWDLSDLASAAGGFSSPDVDLGSSVSRRGTWSIVMLAGTPAVRALWRGTGSSYALTAYFLIRPSQNGEFAIVEGMRFPFAGTCG